VRNIFAATPDAKTRGYDGRRFSFNAVGGRCDECSGQGRVRMEMSFLPDVTVHCESCSGRRFNAETLEITYRGRTIADVLEMSVEEALEFFDSFSEISRHLRSLSDLGLSYLTLGQASTTLSGGEAQRVKLAVELAKTTSGSCLYLLDEPTTGLHMLDVNRLVEVLRRLAQAGHAVVVIEHHQDVILGADWVIDLGPEGGDGGGQLIYQGPVRGLLRAAKRSHTGRCLQSRVTVS
jgi:excinuclease ABC subunit A